MNTIRLSFLVFVLLYSSLKGLAWGAEGHKITAAITNHELSPSVKDSIKFYLGSKSIEDASIWMDEVRSDRSYDVLKPLHYINIEKGQVYNPSDGNIISELTKTIEELKNRKTLSKAVIAIDLKILIHLLGDLHQPLHVGYGLDRGGNGILLTYLETESNLHKVWDSEIIRSKHITMDSCLNLLAEYKKPEIEKIQSGDVVSWMMESREHLDGVYNFQNAKIDSLYVNRSSVLIENQLLIAGLRLSRILAEIFRS